MTPLEALLIRRIETTGPISLHDYMAECLLHPQHGYYTTATPFGARGDFITAPEISQMFGELLGLWLAQAWMDQGAPDRFALVEIGPGRGTLMADMLRATARIPGFHEAAEITLIEASPQLRAAQAAALPRHAPKWLERISDLPDLPIFLIGNEFIDALPVRQFTRHGAGWAETMVHLDNGTLALGLSEPSPLAALAHRLGDTRDGDVVEICPSLPAYILPLSERLCAHGGAALFVDYGDWRSRGDTVQAMRAHGFTGLLETPGQADLTAHVDFEALAKAATEGGATPYGPIGQGALLTALGIEIRAKQLAQSLSGAALDAHLAATRRLTHPDEMGSLFKAMALMAPSAPQPAGFSL